MRLASTVLFTCVVALLALGMVMLFSASTGLPEARYLMMQPVWAALGMAVCWAVAIAGDYRWLRSLAWVLFVIALVLLALVLIPAIARPIKGARRWIEIRGFSVQPSELAKIALIVVLAWYGERFQRQMPKFLMGLVVPGAIAGLVFGLIFLEPDWGTTMLLGAITGVILFMAGTRWYYLGATAAAGAVALVFMILHNEVRFARWTAFLDLEKYREGIGYQTYASIIGIGSGGLTGMGLGNGRQKLGFVPELHTDFIFAVIGEELGLVATVLVLLAFLLILICGLYIARNARDKFGQLLAVGITTLITLQAAINIGVVTGALPNKGLALPFISYGGSSLVLMLGCVGLLQNIARLSDQGDTVLEPVLDPEPAGAI